MDNYIIRAKDLEQHEIVKNWLDAQKTSWKSSMLKLIYSEFRKNGYIDVVTGEGRVYGNDTEKT